MIRVETEGNEVAKFVSFILISGLECTLSVGICNGPCLAFCV